MARGERERSEMQLQFSSSEIQLQLAAPQFANEMIRVTKAPILAVFQPFFCHFFSNIVLPTHIEYQF